MRDEPNAERPQQRSAGLISDRSELGSMSSHEAECD